MEAEVGLRRWAELLLVVGGGESTARHWAAEALGGQQLSLVIRSHFRPGWGADFFFLNP